MIHQAYEKKQDLIEKKTTNEQHLHQSNKNDTLRAHMGAISTCNRSKLLFLILFNMNYKVLPKLCSSCYSNNFIYSQPQSSHTFRHTIQGGPYEVLRTTKVFAPVDFFCKALNEQYDVLRVPGAGGSIGALLHETRINGDAAVARSSKSMLNGTTGDTGVFCYSDNSFLCIFGPIMVDLFLIHK